MRAAPAALLAVVAVVSTGVDHGDAATATDPIFVFSPVPEPSPAPPIPPPEGYLNGPCGLAVDAAGNFYVADYNHDVVDVYDGEEDYTPPPEPVYGSRGYLGQLKVPDPPWRPLRAGPR